MRRAVAEESDGRAPRGVEITPDEVCWARDVIGELYDAGLGRLSGHTLALSLAEAANGCEKTFVVTRRARCGLCEGTGLQPGPEAVEPPGPEEGELPGPEEGACVLCKGARFMDRSLRVTLRVPAGVDTGHVLRVRGRGDQAPDQAAPGDLLVLLSVKPHPRLRRDGDDLHVEIPIDAELAREGGQVTVPTLAGGRPLDVPAGTQDGTRLVLRGHGAVRHGAEPVPIPTGQAGADVYRSVHPGDHRGDQIVTFVVEGDLLLEEACAQPARGLLTWASGVALATLAALAAALAGR